MPMSLAVSAYFLFFTFVTGLVHSTVMFVFGVLSSRVSMWLIVSCHLGPLCRGFEGGGARDLWGAGLCVTGRGRLYCSAVGFEGGWAVAASW